MMVMIIKSIMTVMLVMLKNDDKNDISFYIKPVMPGWKVFIDNQTSQSRGHPQELGDQLVGGAVVEAATPVGTTLLDLAIVGGHQYLRVPLLQQTVALLDQEQIRLPVPRVHYLHTPYNIPATTTTAPASCTGPLLCQTSSPARNSRRCPFPDLPKKGELSPSPPLTETL